MTSQVHVVSKQDLTKHTTLTVELPVSPLGASSVRVRTKVFGITTNNLTYAKLGAYLHWWDTYPVPPGLPAPYNDEQQWGIVPAWGYGEVLESTVSDISTGSWLWGFWPTSAHAFDLKLQPTKEAGTYSEVSEHRQKVLTIYKTYRIVSAPPSEDTLGWYASTSAIWGGGYVISRYIFSDEPSRLVHPMGQGEWTTQDADLTSAVLVSLSATSKTGMSFAWNFAQRKPESAPLGFLQATTSPETVPDLPSSQINHKVVSYPDLTSSAVTDWIADLRPSRLVVLDFGGPTGLAGRFIASVSAKLPETTSVLKLQIGAEAVVTPAPPAASESTSGLQSTNLLLNTSGVLDGAAVLEGAQAVQEGISAGFQRWVDEKGMGSMELLWRNGIAGDGMDKTWEELCTGTFPRHKALALKL